MKRASLLVGFTPTHLIPMLEVAALLPQPVWLFHPDAQRIAPENRSGLRFIGSCHQSRRTRAQKYLAAARQLKHLLRQGDAVVCVPHPFNPLSNHAFFAAGTGEVRLYQDGILNYYDAKNPFCKARVLMGRRLKAAAILLPYRSYRGHLSGMEERSIAAGYFTHPGLVSMPHRFGELHQISFDNVPGASEMATAEQMVGPVTLFLDQPIESFFPEVAARQIRKRAFDYAESFGLQVLYKPHYTQHSRWPIRSHWQLASREERSLPAEELPARRPITAVVSFFSSALANIQLARPQIHCVAVGADAVPVTINNRESTLARLLSGLGVQTVD